MKNGIAKFILASFIPVTAVAQQAVDPEVLDDTTVSADRLLEASFSNGLNPIGVVDKLILDEEKQALEYILLESDLTASRIEGLGDGFLLFEQVDFEEQFHDQTAVVIDEEEAAPGAPEELALSRTEAEERLVERIMDEGIRFADGYERDLTDIYFDRTTGRIVYYAVSLDDDSLFDATQRLIPAEQVQIDEQGQAVASVDLEEIRSVAGL